MSWWWVLVGLVGLLLIYWIGVSVYALGSFLLMRRHVEARPWRQALATLARETWLALLVQPFLPLYYLVGGRMESRRSRRLRRYDTPAPVIFVHGYTQNRVNFLGLARRLEQRSIGPLFGFNYTWFSAVEQSAVRLDRFVRRVCAQTGAPAVDLVCHSMGGLVALEAIAQQVANEDLKVRRCVTIATPHAGVMWTGPILGAGGLSLRRGSEFLKARHEATLRVPTLSIYSDADNIVFPQQSSQLAGRGGVDRMIPGLGHLSILFDAQVATAVADFLLEPGPSELVQSAPDQ